jgi:hypothetical protein
MGQEITFRRIRGRIVPIKLSKRQKEGGKGVALIGAGAAVAGGAGHLTGRAIHAAAKFENVGNTLRAQADKLKNAAQAPEAQMGLPGIPQKRSRKILTPDVKRKINAAMDSSTSAHIKSEMTFRASNVVGRFGKIAGGVLIGAGLTKLYEGVTGKKAGLKEDIAANVTGQVVTSAFDVGLASAVRTGGNLRRAIQLVLKSKLKL